MDVSPDQWVRDFLTNAVNSLGFTAKDLRQAKFVIDQQRTQTDTSTLETLAKKIEALVDEAINP